MNTDMFMSTNEIDRERPPRIHPRFPRFYEMRGQSADTMAPAAMSAQGPRTVGNNMREYMSMYSGDPMPIPMSRNRPRASSRPQMLGRAEGMHSIPRLRPMQRGTNMIPMEPPPQWNTTGMQTKSHTRNAGLETTMLSDTRPQFHVDEMQPDRATWDPGHQQHPSSHIIHHGSVPMQSQQQPIPHKDQESSAKTHHGTSMSLPSGLTRKCSRCHSGFVKDRQRSTDGAIPVPPERGSLTHLNTLKEDTSEANDGTNDDKGENVASLDFAEKVAPSAGHFVGANNVESDTRDHTICCPECCKEQDCHEGCLGHPSLSPSPTWSIRSSTETAGSGYESPPSSKDSDAHSNTSEKVRIGRLAFMKSAFKKSFAGTPNHSRDNSKTSTHSRKTSVAEVDTPQIDLTTHPLSPGTFWGSEAVGSSERTAHIAAVEAAKSAIGLKNEVSVSSNDAVTVPSPLRVKKTRKKKCEAADETRNWTAPTVTPAMDEGEQTTQSEHKSEGRQRTYAAYPDSSWIH